MAAAACASGPGVHDDSGEPKLELTLTNEEGRTLELKALRGRPTLLFLFATYDARSQLALAQLIAASETEQRSTILGVAVQPDAKTFLGMFRETVEPPFELYFDASGALLEGRSTLGAFPGVPAFVAIDAEGNVCRTFVGIPDRAEFERLIESSL